MESQILQSMHHQTSQEQTEEQCSRDDRVKDTLKHCKNYIESWYLWLAIIWLAIVFVPIHRRNVMYSVLGYSKV